MMSQGQLRLELVTHVLILTLSLKTDLPYRQNNRYQHRHYYTKVSCAPPTSFFLIHLQILMPVLQNTSETLYQFSVACNPDRRLSLPKKKAAHGYSYSGAIVNLFKKRDRRKEITTQQSQITALSLFLGGGSEWALGCQFLRPEFWSGWWFCV